VRWELHVLRCDAGFHAVVHLVGGEKSVENVEIKIKRHKRRREKTVEISIKRQLEATFPKFPNSQVPKFLGSQVPRFPGSPGSRCT
jgi:hypothetical protein